MTKTEYINHVLEILESFDYPDLVLGYSEDDVARSIYMTCRTFAILGQSPMMCAITIWSMTINFQFRNRTVN